MPVLVLYVGYLMIATFYPFAAPSIPPFGRSLAAFLTIKGPTTEDFLLNVVLFIPLGALLYFCLECPHRSRPITIWLALAAGAVLSFLVELGQIFFARHPEVSDLIANTSGAASGALMGALCPFRVRGAIPWFWDTVVKSKVFVLLVVTFGSMPLTLSIVHSPWPNFRTWDTNLPFQIANEATMDRPWLGRIYMVAVYNRALSVPEIANNFELGLSANALSDRATKGLVALYTFSEGDGGVVRDVSGVGDPLDLVITPRSHVNWLGSTNGIEIDRPAIVKSKGPAAKLARAFQDGDQISIETWFAPANLTQIGPARLVSFSGDLRRHNFVVGQQDADMVFWLRTLISGRSGGAGGLGTNDRILKLEPSHIVVTYFRGVERIYLNGVQHLNTLDVTKDVVIGFATTKTPTAQIAYSFFYFFPLALFLTIFLASRTSGLMRSLLPPLAAAAGLQAVTEIFEALAFDRAVDFFLIGYGLIIATLGALVGGWTVPTPASPS